MRSSSGPRISSAWCRPMPRKSAIGVIRTREDFYGARGVTGPRRPVPPLPIPSLLELAVQTSMDTRQRLSLTCDGSTWTIEPDAASAFYDWLQGHRVLAMDWAHKKTRGAHRPPAVDWYMFCTRLLEGLARGEAKDAVIDALCTRASRYGITTPTQAARYIKAQRAASHARLRALRHHGPTIHPMDHERQFHAAVVRWLPPEQGGRPRRPPRDPAVVPPAIPKRPGPRPRKPGR
jgi:hypothetical protein